MTYMYDAIASKVDSIPADAGVVAGYDDGHLIPAWTDADWARFPNATHVHITTNGETLTSDVADIEAGDLTPQGAADWIRRRLAAGITTTPTLYCSAANVPNVQAACVGLAYNLWVADWTGTEHLPSYAVACQFSARGVYDVSVLRDGWPAAKEPDPLIGALAYVTDDLGDRLLAIQTELQRVREQFIGPRP